ncbi:MAG: signal peptidase II [Chloroflexota bacterium]
MTGTSGSTARGRAFRAWPVFGGLALAVLVVDQLSKAWVDGTFALASPFAQPGTPGAPTQVLGDLVRIAKSYNDGGIFGLAGSSALLLAAASLIVIAIIVAVEARQGRNDPLLTVALGLLLGGALGNLIDRLRFQHVVDFVDMGVGGDRWYTWNVADAAISVAIVLLLIHGFFGDRLGSLTATGRARQPASRGPVIRQARPLQPSELGGQPRQVEAPKPTDVARGVLDQARPGDQASPAGRAAQ